MGLKVQVRALRNQFPSVSVTPLVADFTMPLEHAPMRWDRDGELAALRA